MTHYDPLKMYYSSPFDLFFAPPTQRVVVISDSEYNEYKLKKAQQEISVLENNKNKHLNAVKEYDLKIEELQKEFPALLSSTDESSN